VFVPSDADAEQQYLQLSVLEAFARATLLNGDGG
jgi:hypothetical protein